MTDPATANFPLVDIDTDDPLVKPLFDAMKARGAGPLHMHRTIAHAPAVYAGFAQFATALRAEGATSRADRELMIVRTTQLRDSHYELTEHKRMALACGLTAEQVEAVGGWRESALFDERQRTILRLADEMYFEPNGVISLALFDTLMRDFPLQAIVELVMTASFYIGLVHFSHVVRVQPETVVTNYGAPA